MSKENKKRYLKKLKEDYQGFGPIKETVHQIMIMSGLHKSKNRKKEKARPLRQQRPRRGESVQIDGSYQAWLEDPAEKSCLLQFIDVVTSEILAAEFVDHESFCPYAALCKRYFR